ncbi:ABC transporter permease subunit [Halocella sp. SP3-1]|uniref:PstA family ABC transporter permease n=1 Tax=Halocella sp. SP3-1 TaxID=2382161 RepID=UPI000F757F0F|nr:ABC transporter permease subunit [Halocella sp. SP3-1]AZO94728.1 ABC transporter permease subunit [Halocella sp. SP3-1]
MKNNKHLGIKLWIILSGLIVIGLVLFIISFIFSKGLSSISFNFIFDRPKGMPLGMKGGVFPAIVGSFYFTLIASCFASFIAIAVAVYIKFYCNNEKISTLVHVVVQSIAGIPSIILGLFGYTFLVVYLKLGISLLAGGLTLGIMIFPFIEVRIEKIIDEVDEGIINSSYALGMSKSYTFLKLILPICLSDMLGTIALAAGLAMGAAAPIIFTGGVVNAPVPKDILSPAMALPYHLYILIGEGISIDKAYETACVLLFLLILLNIIVIFIDVFRRVE